MPTPRRDAHSSSGSRTRPRPSHRGCRGTCRCSRSAPRSPRARGRPAPPPRSGRPSPKCAPNRWPSQVHRAPFAAGEAPVITRAPDGHARAGVRSTAGADAGRGPAPGAREGADTARSGPGAVAAGPGEREGETPPVQPLPPRPGAVLDGLLVRLEEAGERSEHVRGGRRVGGGGPRPGRAPARCARSPRPACSRSSPGRGRAGGLR